MEISVDKMKWYAIRTVSGKERKALENLEREINEQNFDKLVNETLLPMERKYKLNKGKKVSRDVLTFPGYLLINAYMTEELNRLIKTTNQIIEVSGDSGRPVALKQYEVDRIIGKIEESKDEEKVPFIVGELINIIDGPFSSFSGEILKIDDSKKMLKVGVSIFGRVTNVEINYLQADKMS